MKITRWKSLYEQQYKLYCDLDGVLCDFDGLFKSYYNMHPREYKEKYGKVEMWDAIKRINHFFLKLPWFPGAQDLWNKIRHLNPTILTSPAEEIQHCEQDKLDWVKKNLGNYKVIFSKDKFKYADPNSILIDDMDKNIEPWRNAGGVGIKFVNPNQAIKILGNMEVI